MKKALSPKCRLFETCNAPLCPMYKKSLEHCYWFPGEEICRNRRYANELWIKNMRKISKTLCIKPEVDAFVEAGFFTYHMLNRKFVIRKGIKGIDPNKEDVQKELQKWLKAHPEIPQEESKARAERLRIIKRRHLIV